MIFLTKFAQKGGSRSKTENVISAIKFCLFKLVEGPNFSLNLYQSKTEKVDMTDTIQFCFSELA